MRTALHCELVDPDGNAVTTSAWRTFEVGTRALRMIGSLTMDILRNHSGSTLLALRRHPVEDPFLTIPMNMASSALLVGNLVTIDNAHTDHPDIRMDVLLGLAPVRSYEQWRAGALDPTLEAAYMAGFNAGSILTRTLAQEADT